MYWTNRQVISWAKKYCKGGVTLMDMEANLQVSHSTIWWNFEHRLPILDPNLYSDVRERMDYNYKNKPIHRKRG